jgi:hypothetical protein
MRSSQSKQSLDYHNASHYVPPVDMVAMYRMVLNRGRKKGLNTKFMQTLEKDVYSQLRDMAKDRGVTVQEFLRAVIVPDWMHSNDKHRARSRSNSR